MQWFICRYYFVRNVHCTEQLRQLENRAAQSSSGAQGRLFWGTLHHLPHRHPHRQLFISFLITWYFGMVFCPKTRNILPEK